MLTKPDHPTVQALASLKGNQQFETVCQWLRNTLEEIDRDSCVTKDEVQLRWNQGSAQIIRDFLGRSDEAQATIRKFQGR